MSYKSTDVGPGIAGRRAAYYDGKVSLTSVSLRLLLCVAALCAAGGCEDRRRHQASEQLAPAPAPPPLPADAAPADVARALLDALAAAQRARREGLTAAPRRDAYDEAMGRAASLADREAIHQRVKQARTLGFPPDVTPDAALRQILESWTSLAAYYSDGLQDALIRPTPLKESGLDCHVFVDVERPEDRVRLAAIEADSEVVELRGRDGQSSQAYRDVVQAKAIERGFVPPITARLDITLRRRTPGPWRVAAMDIRSSPASSPSGIGVRPTTLPVTTQLSPANTSQ